MKWLNSANILGGTLLLALVTSAFLGYLTLYYLPPTKYKNLKQLPEGPRHFELEEGKDKNAKFDLLDPELAPPAIKERVMQGYQLMLNTPKFAAKYSGNTLTCNHCHFDAGNTFGGKNGGISLVGVSMTYPMFSQRSKELITLQERIQNCFVRSMNGNLPPLDDPIQVALVAYLDWISTPVDRTKDVPWLGLQMIQSTHTPDPVKGGLIYTDRCAACHQPDGGGTEGVPALWGHESFNDGAGMNQVPRLSAFVFANMPYQDANLKEEEALDVAAFITQQTRPHFMRPEGLK